MPNKSYTVEKVGSIVKLTEREELIIDQLFSREEVKAGDYLLKMGEVCNKTWLIEKGIIQFNIVEDGEYRTFVFRGEGEFTSDMDSFINKSVSQKNIIALEECVLHSITYEQMQTLFATVSQGERFGRLLAERAFVSVVNHFISFYTKTPEERYLSIINSKLNLLQRVPQYLIASYLGIKPQSLSRIRRRFSQK